MATQDEHDAQHHGRPADEHIGRPAGEHAVSAPATTSQAPGARARRGPGWLATIGIAIAAALIATGATAAVTAAIAPNEEPARIAQSADPAAPAPMTADGVDLTAVADAVSQSVVSIQVQSQGGVGQGSGVFIDEQGHILTNNHVVAGGGTPEAVIVTLGDGRVYEAEVVGTDASTDLAVIRVQGDPPDDIAPVVFGDSDAVEVGQPVMAVGNPLGLSDTVTTGIVSEVDRPVTTTNSGPTPTEDGTPVVSNAIQTDAAINPGNSGGALVDGLGRLVGVNSSIASASNDPSSAGSIGLGFAIPANQARWVAESLIDDGAVDHAYLGVQLRNTVVQTETETRVGAGVVGVVDGTPAAASGITAGDTIVAIDAEPVAGAEALVAQVREREPGTAVTLTVVNSDGQSRDVDVEFGARPIA